MRKVKPTKDDLYDFMQGIANGDYGQVSVEVKNRIYNMLDIMAGRNTYGFAVDDVLALPVKEA